MNRSPIYQQVTLGRDKLLNPPPEGTFRPDIPVLLLPAAGRAIVSGGAPCCVEPVLGLPLIRHSIDAFRQAWPGAPVVCIVGQDSQCVVDAIGGDVYYVQTANPDGGTGWATYEAFCLPELLESNPNIIISMGDRIVPRIVYEKLLTLHAGTSEQSQAVFSMTTVQYDPPMNRGRGRIVRDPGGRMMQILEEEEILREENRLVRNSLLSLTEGNCPIYVLRARTLIKYLMLLSNDNARKQYYLTDIVGEIARDGGDIRSIQIRSSQPEYAVLCTDVSGPDDIVRLEQALRLQQKENDEIVAAARQIRLARPTGQVDSICRQLRELYRATQTRKLGFRPDEPVAIGISGGRLRIALMHPDMGRFYGPALQTPLGAANEQGTEQIVLCLQESDDRRVHLFPLNPLYRESVDSIRADVDEMYPGDDVCDPYSYEEFGTRMSRRVLLGLGYFSEEELENRRQQGMPLPPRSLWVENNMRRPFSLVGNAIASLRTCRHGETGKTIQNVLGRDHFRGLRLASTGSLPQGGFSSSSALTVATKNAMNVLFNLGLTSDQLVQLACQAEYGTGVRAGALDQATEQKGAAGVGTLLSSNPREQYRVLGQYSVPPETIRVLFPYSVSRDVDSHLWSAGYFADGIDCRSTGILTTLEVRKMTGKAAEIAAILLERPLDCDFFQEIQNDLLQSGELGMENQKRVARILLSLPLFIERDDLINRVSSKIAFYADELVRCFHMTADEAIQKSRSTFKSLFEGWRNPLLPLKKRQNDDRGFPFENEASGYWHVVRGVPLRAMVAYLFAETARNFYMFHHSDRWIEGVDRSQWGDCCFRINPAALPNRQAMEDSCDWDKDSRGAARLAQWLRLAHAEPFDFTEDLDDAALSNSQGPQFQFIRGSNFFRGLALIDLAGAMLKRAFGENSVAVRVNAAGQGDYFQVHVDTRLAAPEEVKRFIQTAIYARFELSPMPEFIEVHPGGPALGIRLNRFALIPQLIEKLRCGK